MNLVSDGFEKFVAEIHRLNPFFHSAKVVRTLELPNDSIQLDEDGNYAGVTDSAHNFLYLVLPKEWRWGDQRTKMSSCNNSHYSIQLQFKIVALGWNVCAETLGLRMVESIVLAESATGWNNVFMRVESLTVDRQRVAKMELGEDYALPDAMELISVGGSVRFDWNYDFCNEINLCQ